MEHKKTQEELIATVKKTYFEIVKLNSGATLSLLKCLFDENEVCDKDKEFLRTQFNLILKVIK